MSIIIGGDLVPTKANENLFIKGNTQALLGDKLLTLLENADYRIFNLETPLVNKYTPIVKAGPALLANTETVTGIKAMGVDLLALANNHIMDQGIYGLDSTRSTLQKAEISFVGVGNNIAEASRPFFFEQSGKRIGVLACAEHEFSIACENAPGAYGFDLVESFDLIQEVKGHCDYLIILYHGGKEYYRYPSPYLQRICRKMVDKGADLIVCQHSHCVGCKEEYKFGTIVYGQGNFLFDLQHDEFWHSGLLIRINDDGNIDYIPIVQNGNAEVLAGADEAKAIMNDFDERSNEITQPGFTEEKHKRFSDEHIEKYLFAFSGVKRTFLYKIVNKLSGHRYERWLLCKKYSKDKLTVLENFIECEAHRELVLEGIKDIIHGKN